MYPSSIFQICCKSFAYIVVTLLVVVALALSLARLLVPSIESYKSDVEVWVSEQIGQQVEIATLDAGWYGVEPQLILKGVRLLSDDRMQIHGYFQQARLGIDLYSSALEGRLLPGAFTLEGARFVLVRQTDGNVSIEGLANSTETENSENKHLLDEWLFKQRFLEVKNSEIVWIDLSKDGKPSVFSDVNLRLRNDGASHRVDGWVNLPDSLGARLEVAIDVQGSLLSGNTWSGEVYVETEKLNVAELSQYFPEESLNIGGGKVNFRLWSHWDNAKLVSVRGNASLNDVQVSAKHVARMRVINQLTTNFLAVNTHRDWEITLDKVQVKSGRRLWPQTRIDIKYNPQSGRLDTELAYLDLKEVLPLMRFVMPRNSELSKTILGLNATGIVSDLFMQFHPGGKQDEYFATGRLSGLTTHPWRDIPGVQNLDAQFKVSPHAASIAIPRQNVQLDYPQKFLAAHALTDLKSSIFANFKQSALQLAVKDMAFKLRGAQVYGSFNYDDQAVQGKQLDLALYFDNAQIDDVEYFVPAKMLPRETVDWLTQALRGGRAQHGGLLFFGELKHFPFQAADGLFDVRFDVAHGELQFASDWPEIQSIQGAFELDSNKLTFAGKSGKTMGAELSKVKIALPDFHTADKHLTIVGEVRGKTQNKLLYLLSTPLAESLSASLAPLHLDGESELSLDLNIPLLLPKETQFFGELSVKENRALAKEWKLDIEKFSTHLRFNNDGVWSDDLQGKLRQTAFQGRVETQDAPSSGRQVVLRTFSEVSDKEVLDLLGYFINKPNWGEYFSGNTEVETDIVFPLGSEDKPLQLVLSSDMRGMAVDLPYPLRKPKAEGKHLILSADLTGEQRYLNISYGDTDAIFESFASKDALQMLRGGIGFKEKAVLPDEIGYRFSGKLKEFAWAEWGPLLIPEAGKKGLLGEGGSSGSIYFDVNVEKFALFGNKFAETSIQASHTSNLWSMHLSGKELEGNIIVPVVMSSAPMVVNMSRLYVSPEAEQGNRVDIDPREMPEIKLKVADFRYKDIPFGALEVNAKKTSDGLHLDRLDIKTKKTTVSAQGDWLVTAQGQESRFNVAIESKDLGRAIKNWGYAGAISGGEGEIKLDVNWPGQPLDFDFKVANGDVDIAIKNASMLGFDLGAAKMFGLFLPRRLLLDFRDVFKKGMYFDEIKGRYTIQTGEAFTTGLFLKGPVADIHMAGRLGLSKRDYDLVVTVNRRIIGDSVPVLAALAVTPLLAAQVFIIKKMFEQQIEDILSIQYTIEGSWDDPVITPVIKNPETGEDVLDDIFEE